MANGFHNYLAQNGLAKDVYICEIKINQVQLPPIFYQKTQLAPVNAPRPNIQEEWARWNQTHVTRESGVVILPRIQRYPTSYKMAAKLDVKIPLDLTIQRFIGHNFR